MDRGEERFAWQEQALCAQTDPETFHPEKGYSNKAAKQVCALCVVRPDCFDYAMGDPELMGVFGGTTQDERKKLRKQLKKAS